LAQSAIAPLDPFVIFLRESLNQLKDLIKAAFEQPKYVHLLLFLIA
jgi:hypothetical protein